MESKEVFTRIEKIIDEQINSSGKTGSNLDEESKQNKNEFKEIIYLALHLVLNVFKAPFKFAARYLRDEILIAVKNDAKVSMVIMGMMGVLFVFFSVIWLFISVAIGVYYYDNGNSVLTSIIYSLIFQILSFVVVGLIAFAVSKKLKSMETLKRLNKYSN